MNLVVLLALDSLQVLAVQADLERFDTYDLLGYEIAVKPLEAGADVDCRLTLQVTRQGPLRFFLTREVENLTVERGGKAVPAAFAEWGLGAIAGLFAKHKEDVPKLLTLPTAPVGSKLSFRIRYRWKPSGKSLAYAENGALQTHLASAWVPSIPHEFFDAKVSVETKKLWVASEGRAQTVCLVVGDYRRHRHGAYELLLAPGSRADADAILKDAEAIGKQLTAWFGPALHDPFRIVIDPRMRAGGYCAGPFASLHREAGRGRGLWLSLLAHEMAHAWWGHKLATPVIGHGGTWLREGLAEWSAIKVLGAMLGPEVERRLFRKTFRDYFRTIDLRHPKRGPKGVVFANEATLWDATYADPPAIPYKRGALVHRLLEHGVGRERFLAVLKKLAQGRGERLLGAAEFARALDAVALVEYYAKSTRLPDFEIHDGTLRCLDPGWPGKKVPCLVDGRPRAVAVGEKLDGKTVEIDPERIYLDPKKSNNKK